MQEFTLLWMPYIQLTITIVVGVGLGLIIKHKNSLISTLTANFQSTKQLLDLYDAQKFKDYNEMIEKTLELKHKKELQDAITITADRAKDNVESTIKTLSSPWLEKYDELLNFYVNIILNLSAEDKERYLKLLPKNRNFINQILENISDGTIKPDRGSNSSI